MASSSESLGKLKLLGPAWDVASFDPECLAVLVTPLPPPRSCQYFASDPLFSSP